ncbi:heteromeric transposase endonuclease subunit TnsA [Niallia circulans]|uniref:TnsA endonuclease N-terminal domain-containing protein n=1 Tax=Niallia circulans TaxID=1397 RepID=UPI000F44B7A7|nr:TnsA endonuclease N-terminal domain-containing protein [Niallia circulans]AYV68922.1 heteromeric transposase endonuclease subunit TnsA [Niallia circulans]
MKYRSKWTEKSIERRIKKGFGQGYMESYIPWLMVQDVPSIGVVTRAKGKIVPRVYHFMSQLEYQYFCLLEWSENVNDIREQFPLFQREDAQYIAEQKGIAYPIYPKTNVPVVMTSDFAIQFIDRDGTLKEVVRTIKPSNELKKKRVLEKLEIEREYWKRRGVDWGIVTEKEICPVLIHNLNFFQGAYYFDNNFPVSELAPYFFEGLFKNQNQLVIKLLLDLDNLLNKEKGTYLAIFKFLLSRKVIGIDMSNPIDLQNLLCNELNVLGGANLLNALHKDGTGGKGA